MRYRVGYRVWVLGYKVGGSVWGIWWIWGEGVGYAMKCWIWGYGASGGCWGLLTVSPPDFTRALGSGLSDKCLETLGGPPGPGCSRTAQQLRCLFPALALALRCLSLLPARPHGERGLGRGQVGLGILSVLTPTLSSPQGSLPAAAGAGPVPGGGGCCPRVADGPGRAVPGGLGTASVPAAHPGRPAGMWAQGARGSGGTQEGWIHSLALLQVLKAEAEQLMLQVSGTFPEPEEIHRDSPPEPLPSPGSPWELQLCRQIRDMANSIQVWMANSIPHCRRGILSTTMLVSPGVTLCHPMFSVSQLFSGDVLWMFSTSCKRLSAEIFDQTMPLGRHWRLRPRAGGCWGWGGCGVLGEGLGGH